MTTPRVSPRPARNSFGKAMLLTVLALIPIILLGVLSGKDANAAGYDVGYYGAAPILAGIAVGIWAKIAKTRWNWFSYLWRFLAVGTAVLVLASIGNATGSMARITEPEKQHLVIGQREVRHDDFGFVVPLPGDGFHVDAALQQQANQEFKTRGIDASTYAWVLRSPQQNEVVMLMLTKGTGGNEAALRGLGRGLNRGAEQQGAQVVQDTMEWSRNAHEYRFASIQQGVYIRARCLASPGRGAASYILCVQTVSTDPAGLDETRAGAKVTAWR